MEQITFIFVPGLNDERPISRRFYKFITKHWSRGGLRSVLVAVRWESDEPYQQKLQRLVEVIDTEAAAGRKTVLVGISAGASLVMLAYAERKNVVLAIVSVCGLLWIHSEEKVKVEHANSSWFAAARASTAMVPRLNLSDRQRILAFVPLVDHVIKSAQQQMPSVQIARLYSGGHVTSIAVCLFFYRQRIRRFCRKLSSF